MISSSEEVMAEYYCRFDDPVSVERLARPENTDQFPAQASIVLVGALLWMPYWLVKRWAARRHRPGV